MRASSSQDPKLRRQGAHRSKVSTTDKFSAWRKSHWMSAKDSLRRLLRQPLESLMTWLVIAVAISLPVTLHLTVNSFSQLADQWQGTAQISIFLNPRIKPLAIENLSSELESHSAVKTVGFVAPEEALKSLQNLMALGDLTAMLDSNPLPPALVVTLGEEASANQAGEIANLYSQDSRVDDVRVDLAWVQRMRAITDVAERLVLTLASLLGVGLLLVVGNTIRLSIESRRDEILVVKLVGGTDAFVRRPFLYTGIWYGFGGGLLALLIVSLGGAWIGDSVARLANLYGSEYRLAQLSLLSGVSIPLSGACIGLVGAIVSVQRHLKRIEPN